MTVEASFMEMIHFAPLSISMHSNKNSSLATDPADVQPCPLTSAIERPYSHHHLNISTTAWSHDCLYPMHSGEGAGLITRLLCAKELLPRKGGGGANGNSESRTLRGAPPLRDVAGWLDMDVQQWIRREMVFVLRRGSCELVVGDRCQQERHV